MTVSRRDFTRLLALTGSAAMLREFPRGLAEAPRTPLPPTPLEPDERFWMAVRGKFLMPKDSVFVNAANLCPTSLPVFDGLAANTKYLDTDPSSVAKAKLMQGREESRRLVAASLRAAPEEIILTRNTSEANNLVSSGLKLGPGDEVI